ncbi:MAG: type II toxin-antitoxin system RelE/ParE family toxin [Candidatus Nanohaloarchaea archaeon]|nr:type II toxin-antitoxin system RelE/ParE family toxin [Candidatus Nanohaloarchaea archaeon]
MSYEIEWKKEAIKDLQKLETEEKERIVDKIEWFSGYPKRRKNIKFIDKFSCHRYRIGDFRVFFRKNNDDSLIEILAVERRGKAYR